MPSTRLEAELRRELPGPRRAGCSSRRSCAACRAVQRRRSAHCGAASLRELPGAAAQERLAPVPRRAWPTGFNPARIRHAAGLLLLYPDHDRAHIVLTVRADTLGRHGGQVSLPGGVVDPGETFEQAALREAHEEVALHARPDPRARRADAARHSGQRIPPASDRRRRPTRGPR